MSPFHIPRCDDNVGKLRVVARLICSTLLYLCYISGAVCDANTFNDVATFREWFDLLQ